MESNWRFIFSWMLWFDTRFFQESNFLNKSLIKLNYWRWHSSRTSIKEHVPHSVNKMSIFIILHWRCARALIIVHPKASANNQIGIHKIRPSSVIHRHVFKCTTHRVHKKHQKFTSTGGDDSIRWLEGKTSDWQTHRMVFIWVEIDHIIVHHVRYHRPIKYPRKAKTQEGNHVGFFLIFSLNLPQLSVIYF